MTRLTARRSYSLAAVLLVTIGVLGALASPTSSAQAAAPAQAGVADRPNIVLVLSDDQAKGTMAAMPKVLSKIRDKGVTFKNGVIPTSVCCPSRASLLTGNLAHSTGVYSNEPSRYGGWPAFRDNESQTLATELSAAGYRTGLFGKYMNGFTELGWEVDGEADIPPGWDEFVVMNPFGNRDSTYYNYSLVGTQLEGPFERRAADYSTDVLRDQALEFIRSTPSGEPFFAMLSVAGPHPPAKPAPRHKGTWPMSDIRLPVGVNERDMSDKPAWLQDKPRVDRLSLKREQRRVMETLMSVDEATGALVKAVERRAPNTLFVYLSDNGVMQGVHRLTNKNVAYRLAHEVPMYMRWDGVIEPNSVSERITANIDVTATIAEAAGVTWPMEGKSALSSPRTGIVLEAVRNGQRPPYCGWRSQNYLYVRYTAGEGRELYDYRVDPAELDNVAGKAEYAGIEARLDRKTERHCQPFPPEFSWD